MPDLRRDVRFPQPAYEASVQDASKEPGEAKGGVTDGSACTTSDATKTDI
jgi:hypothetical protein